MPPVNALHAMSADPPGVADPIVEARRGDPAALAALYSRHGNALYGIAWRLTGSAADAEDVLHDLFVGLPELLQRYEERGQLRGWLCRVVVRLSLVQLRRARRRGEVDLTIAELAHAELASAASAESSAATASALDLARALDSLPTTLRTVVVLKQFEGYSHEEIAELLDITTGASRVRYLRALRQLRQLLEPDR